MQRRALRTSVVVASLVVAGVSPVTGGLLALSHPDRAPQVVGLYGACTVVALGIALGTPSLGRHRPGAFAFALGLLGVSASLLSVAVLPETHVLTAAGLAITPVAVALFLPWSARLHLLWLAVAALVVVGWVLWPLRLEFHFAEEERDTLLGFVIGATVSAAGHSLTHRLRLAAFGQKEHLRAQRGELRRFNRELEETLRHAHRLEGLLPICAGCKSIRDEEGRWVPVERYVGARSAAEFSHGLCPDCAARLYPEYADEMLRPSG